MPASQSLVPGLQLGKRVFVNTQHIGSCEKLPEPEKKRLRQQRRSTKKVVRELWERGEFERARQRAACGETLYYKSDSEEGPLRRVGTDRTCGMRFLCRTCHRRWSNRQVKQHLGQLEQIQRDEECELSFVTLTLQRSQNLERAFRDLRNAYDRVNSHRRDFGRGKGRETEFCRVRHGVWVFDFACNDDGWNAHLHGTVLVRQSEMFAQESQFPFDEAAMSDEWKRCTGTSDIVDVSRPEDVPLERRSAGNALHYSMKWPELSDRKRVDLYQVAQGKQLVRCWKQPLRSVARV